MSDYNNNNGNKTPMTGPAKVVFIATIASFFLIAFAMLSRSPILIMLSVVLIFGIVIFAFATTGRTGAARSRMAVNTTQFNKYMPLLADERTKQHPEVQRLLQYPEVQKAFFDPSTLSNPAISSDEHVQELFRVFDEMLAQGALNGTVYGPQSNLTPMQTPMQSAMPMQPKPVNTTHRKVGLILDILGSSMFVLPLLSVFFVTTNPGSSISISMMSFVISSAVPLGIILIVVGTIMRRR